MPSPRDIAAELALGALNRHGQLIQSLAEAYKQAGFRLALVGGPVRDAILGRLGNDLDFTTNARPEASSRILKKWADAVWETGAAFGTIAAKKGDVTV